MKKQLISKLLEVDKQSHAKESLYLVFIGFLYFQDLLLAVLFSLIIGVGKELIYDKLLKKGTPDIWDFVANCVGILGASFIIKVSLFYEVLKYAY